MNYAERRKKTSEEKDLVLTLPHFRLEINRSTSQNLDLGR